MYVRWCNTDMYQFYLQHSNIIAIILQDTCTFQYCTTLEYTSIVKYIFTVLIVPVVSDFAIFELKSGV